MAKDMFEITIFPRMGIDMVYKKNINLRKSHFSEEKKNAIHLAMYPTTGCIVPLDQLRGT